MTAKTAPLAFSHPDGDAAPENVLVVTGEASGDCYAAQVLKAFGRHFQGAPPPVFFGSGGDAMRGAGAELLMDIHQLSAIGPFEACKLAGNYFRLFSRILREVKIRRTRVALLVDFPDFNLPLAGFLRRRGVKVLYYISPTIWAWRPGRIKVIRRNVSRMLCIFPFEETLYRDKGVSVEYVGHPLMSTVEEIEPPETFRERYQLSRDRLLVSILPGSRRKEIQHILPVLLDALPKIAQQIPEALFLIPAASETLREDIHGRVNDWLQKHAGELNPGDIRVLNGDTTNCLANSRGAIVKSGTSTLQAAIAGTPFVMVYRTTPLTWKLGQIILRNRFFCIVNLIADQEIVPEILQEKLTAENVARSFLDIVESKETYAAMKERIGQVRETLGRRSAPQSVALRLQEALEGTPVFAPGGLSD